MRTIKKLLKEYNGVNKDKEETIFRKCEELLIDPTKHLKYESLRKLIVYAELALKRLDK